ncbi:MAG: M50 family metallopeptidase [Alphaproteobacteria bacterium]
MSQSIKIRLEFLLLLFLALSLQLGYWNSWKFLYGINLPFRYFGVFFHELGHALSSILTGSKAYLIKMVFFGGGITFCGEDPKIIIAFAGYCSGSLVGVVLFYFISNSLESTIMCIPYILLGIFATVGLLFIRDFETLLILILMWGTIRALIYMVNLKEIKLFLKFIAIYLIIDGGVSAYFTNLKTDFDSLISFAGESAILWDGAKISKLTGYNINFIVNAWISCSVLALSIAWLSNEKSIKVGWYNNYEELSNAFSPTNDKVKFVDNEIKKADW